MQSATHKYPCFISHPEMVKFSITEIKATNLFEIWGNIFRGHPLDSLKEK